MIPQRLCLRILAGTLPGETSQWRKGSLQPPHSQVQEQSSDRTATWSTLPLSCSELPGRSPSRDEVATECAIARNSAAHKLARIDSSGYYSPVTGGGDQAGDESHHVRAHALLHNVSVHARRPGRSNSCNQGKFRTRWVVLMKNASLVHVSHCGNSRGKRGRPRVCTQQPLHISSVGPMATCSFD